MVRYIVAWILATLTSAQPGVFYTPFHNGYDTNATRIAATMDYDLGLLKTHFPVVRTDAASYQGVDIAPIASKYNISLLLGISTNTDYGTQVASAIIAVQNYPNTIQAILVGADSLIPYGALSPSDLVARINDVKARILVATGVSVLVGTSQRLDRWLSSDMEELGSLVDIIGLQIYPYLDSSFSIETPLDIIQSAFISLSAQYPMYKLFVTETGYPTSSESSFDSPHLNAIYARSYFNQFTASSFAGIWYSAFDSRTNSTRVGMPQANSFGLYTASGNSKGLLPALSLESSSISPITQGVCYSPFHADEYPLNGGSAARLPLALDADFKLMSKHFSVVRTYYSTYIGGNDVAVYADKHKVQLFIGVFMTTESWYSIQVAAAINAAIKYPDTIKAILVGNENVAPYGPYKASFIVDQINYIRNEIKKATGRSVPVGTVQRATEWLDRSARNEMLNLAANCDVIGVNIYPFFDNGYRASDPLNLLQAIWNQMLDIYPAQKLRLTEIGFATGGPPSSISPSVIPSLANSIQFYNAFQSWIPRAGGGEAFWYSMFDLRADDTTQPAELEKHFGFFSASRQVKALNYPVLRRISTITPPTAPTSAPTPTPAQQPPGVVGVLYSPFHADEYPKDVKNFGSVLTLDLQIIRQRFTTIRTTYANYYNVDVTPFAAAVGLKVFLGVGMTRENWYSDQASSAINAVRYFPDTVSALLVGNENAYVGDYFKAPDIIATMNTLREQVLTQTGRSVRMGTVQRATEWLNPALRNEMRALGEACDIIGVTLALYDTDNLSSPATALQKWWTQLTALYPASKIHLMDIGFPTSGTASAFNVANLEKAQAFYNAFNTWQSTARPPSFFASFYDDKEGAAKNQIGFYTAQRQPKQRNYPVVIGAT